MAEHTELEVEEFFIAGDFPCCITKHTYSCDSPPYDPKRPFSAYPSVHWNGYMGVPKAHPWYGVEYDDVKPYPGVHGGLTFGQKECNDREYNREKLEYLLSTFPKEYGGGGIEFDQFVEASIPKYLPIEPREPYPYDTGMDIWWFGFDTVHGGDWNEKTGESYWPPEKVKEEIHKMVATAAEAWRLHIAGEVT